MTSKAEEFERKVNELSDQIKKLKGDVQEQCVPRMMIFAIALPIVLWLTLFFLHPGFVSKKEGNKIVRDKTKIFQYTIGITVVGWVLMYMYSYYSSHSLALLCTR